MPRNPSFLPCMFLGSDDDVDADLGLDYLIPSHPIPSHPNQFLVVVLVLFD
jgi:hypothetical protein